MPSSMATVAPSQVKTRRSPTATIVSPSRSPAAAARDPASTGPTTGFMPGTPLMNMTV